MVKSRRRASVPREGRCAVIGRPCESPASKTCSSTEVGEGIRAAICDEVYAQERARFRAAKENDLCRKDRLGEKTPLMTGERRGNDESMDLVVNLWCAKTS